MLGEEKYLERWKTHYSAVMKYLGKSFNIEHEKDILT